MSKLRITTNELHRMQPEMPEAFAQRGWETLHSLKNAKEEPIVKRKISFGLVMAIVMMLVLSAVALAVVHWRGAGEQVAAMEASLGYFDTWSAESKIELVRVLNEAGEIEGNAQVDALLNGSITGAEADKVACEIITQRVELPEDAISFISIMESILGKFPTWSVEDKAWYSAVLQETGRLGSDEEIHLLPAADDITAEKALGIAQKAVSEAYGISLDTVSSYAADYDFYAMPGNFGQTKWLMGFRPAMEEGFSDIPQYLVAMDSKSGEVINDAQRGIVTPLEALQYTERTAADHVGEDALRAQKGESYKWSLEERAMYMSWHGAPGAEDLSQESALAIAKEALQNKVPPDTLSKCMPYASFIIDDSYLPTPYWQVDFIRETESGQIAEIYTVYIDARTGGVLGGVMESNG